MKKIIDHFTDDFDTRFKLFYELMSRKVNEVLLVSSLYDACIMEEDCRLAERIIHEYRGLNLSKPPRLTWVSSAEKALEALEEKKFDLVLTMPRLADMNPTALGAEIKSRYQDLPVILLAHQALPSNGVLQQSVGRAFDRIFVWSGSNELLVAVIKSVEDRWNVRHDTSVAGVRVILLVEDSPFYLSSLLPILYREVVGQTQAVMEEGLNEEHRLLTMRARAKILVAETYEEALALAEEFKPYLLGVISDVRFSRNGKLDPEAGLALLEAIKAEIPDLPLLLTSSEPSNAAKAQTIPAAFVDKNSPSLHNAVHSFFLDSLGFGDFVFRMPDGTEVARVSNRRSLEEILPSIPAESFYYHCQHNDFSRWLFARSEILLAARLRPFTADDFSNDVSSMRDFVISSLRARRKWRQKGVVADFEAADFDPDTDFFKIGKGSLGGKARGLAFLSTMLQRNPWLHEKYPGVEIKVPQTLVLTTEAFDSFLEQGDLKGLSKTDAPDAEVARRFLAAELPEAVEHDLRAYLSHVKYPLAVRSSGLLEDAQYRAYAGLYRTCMLPNNHSGLDFRVKQVVTAVKMVYASTYFQGPKQFAKRVGQRTEEEKMAVIIQQLIGRRYGDHFYPAISGVAQSHNYYPFAHMKPEEGCATMALGLGKIVVEGGSALRFSPKHPKLLPQFSKVDDFLNNSQRYFYSLKMEPPDQELGLLEDNTLDRRDLSEIEDDSPLAFVASTYIPEEHRIRDTVMVAGLRVITFAPILKFNLFPLPEILSDILALGQDGMGCSVEFEVSANLCPENTCTPEFAILQVRPMTARVELTEVQITETDLAQAFCYSTQALGNTERSEMSDLVFVKPESFDPGRTVEIAREIGQINARLVSEGRPYVLIGPGRWGSADRWLGIPVTWADISGVGAIVEATDDRLKAEPSQGSHFFHNVTTLGINYLTVTASTDDFINWDWLARLNLFRDTTWVAQARLAKPIIVKVDGRTSRGVIYSSGSQCVRAG